MSVMPRTDTERPPNQQDRVTEPGDFEDEPRNFESPGRGITLDDDTAASYSEMDDPDINTHGSER
jgi:hypothetical protein